MALQLRCRAPIDVRTSVRLGYEQRPSAALMHPHRCKEAGRSLIGGDPPPCSIKLMY